MQQAWPQKGHSLVAWELKQERRVRFLTSAGSLLVRAQILTVLCTCERPQTHPSTWSDVGRHIYKCSGGVLSAGGRGEALGEALAWEGRGGALRAGAPRSG